MNFPCLYCKKPFSPFKFSKQHIIPESFGKSPILKMAVCETCNHAINKQVEGPIIKKLMTLRALLQLEGKRRKRPTMPVKAMFRGASCLMFESPDTIGGRLLVFKVTDRNGKKNLAFIGPPETVKKTQKEYQMSHPEAKWEDIGEEDQKDVQFQLEFDFGVFGSQEALRLAAKIALEWWCDHLKVYTLDGYEYDSIRDFVLTGRQNENQPIVWIIADEAVINAMQPHFPIHSILIGSHPRSRDVLAIVGLFGLVYYKVILTRHHAVFAPYQEMTYFNPQRSEPYKPQIHMRIDNFPLHRMTRLDMLKPSEAIKRIVTSGLERLNAGLREVGVIKELDGKVVNLSAETA